MIRYPIIATIASLIVTIYAFCNGVWPHIGFWGHLWTFIIGSLFLSLGMMAGELFRRFAQPNQLRANGTMKMLEKRLFWKVGPQFIGAIVGGSAVDSFMQNVLGYYIG